MVDTTIKSFVEQFAGRRRQHLESILYYPHPFTPGGLIFVFEDEVELLNLIADVYQEAPTGLSLHCLRHRELFELALPGIFAPPLQVNERPHLPYWLKHKGLVLYGRDLRQEVQPATEPRMLLAGHIGGCMDYLRRYGILTLLIEDRYSKLLQILEREMKYLMATALLIHNEWDVNLETIPEHFWRFFPDEHLKSTWQHFRAQHAEIEIGHINDPAQAASDAVWLFETFLQQFRRYTV